MSSIIYSYDGTYSGLMCCVFESVYKKEEPEDIISVEEEQTSLFTTKFIETDEEKALRVKASIPKKIGNDAKYLVEHAFLSCAQNKEIMILQFLRLGYKHGAKITKMLTLPCVDGLGKAVLHLNNEAHLLKGFIRFSEYDGVLMTTITPKNDVLPVIAEHFCSRFSGETFMIYDKNHKYALVYKDMKPIFTNIEHLEEPQADPTELKYRELWRNFYNTIGIKERYNPKCRRSHMPIRYWENMTEFK